VYKELPDKLNIPDLEKEILDYWAKNNTFEKSITSRDKSKSFTFYEGPPTANGKPGIHHVISRTLKDMVCRYKTLQGYQIHRKAGWDTQGLPVEIEIEKELGFKHKDEIEKFGIENFNKACKESVFKYLKDWEEFTRRLGYWVNLDDAYITFTNDYIESVWWSLKQFFDAGLIYKGYKIQPYCPRCETPLSSHEVAQGYEDVKDPSVYVVFKISKAPKELEIDDYQFLVWTTTPWTLISNVALAVGPDITYVKLQFSDTGEKIILAKDRLSVITQHYDLLGEIKGSDLEGIEYEQLLKYVKVDTKAFYVVLGDFVTTEDGSGIVHIAPAFGEDDYQVSRKYNLPVVQPVNGRGEFTEEVTDFKGCFVKEADDDIIQKLRSEAKLYRKEKFVHSYPHCWRCHTPLLYYARESWYVNTSSYKDKMIELNNTINWFPPETGSGRFGNWLEENRDWALSRDRYWGTPLPIWVCDCKECKDKYQAIGSITELKDKAVNFREIFPEDKDIDLHKPFIDRIKIKCDNCRCEMTRVEEVIDAWYDSGAMPFAQHHFPFENKDYFEKNYPSDFICEAIDQTRGWFYSLHAIGSFLFKKPAYKNILVHDLILDKEGMKMSKHKGNVVDPFMIMDKYGADVLRWYIIGSSPPWRPKTFIEDDLVEIRNKFFDTLVNTYRFFVLYSNLLDYTINKDYRRVPVNKRPEIDRWIISASNSLKRKYIELMDSYEPTRAARLIFDFTIDDLSNWYVRRNRRRFRNPVNNEDRDSAYQTLYEVLVELSKMVSPFSPYISEEIYKNLTGEESVHLSYIENPDDKEIDEKLETEMHVAQQIVYLVRMIRVKHNLKTRQPLRQIIVPVLKEEDKHVIKKMERIILDEVNVKELNIVDEESGIIKKSAKPNYRVLGPKFGKDMKAVAEKIKSFDHHDITILEKDGKINISLNCREFTITKEDIEIQTEDLEGWFIESAGSITVALDTHLDKELEAEGIAREFISKVQNKRKELNLGVNDRIHTFYESDIVFFKNQEQFIKSSTGSIDLKIEKHIESKVKEISNFMDVIIKDHPFKIYIEKE
jgi:isoleucyl-tRNA synthetase